MLELVSNDYVSGRVWRPKNVESRLILQHLIQKDHIDDDKVESLEFVAEFHGIDISFN